MYADILSQCQSDEEVYADILSQCQSDEEVYADILSQCQSDEEVYADILQGRIQDFQLGGVPIFSESDKRIRHEAFLGGSGGMPPQENFVVFVSINACCGHFGAHI